VGEDQHQAGCQRQDVLPTKRGAALRSPDEQTHDPLAFSPRLVEDGAAGPLQRRVVSPLAIHSPATLSSVEGAGGAPSSGGGPGLLGLRA